MALAYFLDFFYIDIFKIKEDRWKILIFFIRTEFFSPIFVHKRENDYES